MRSKKALQFWKPTADKVPVLRSSRYRLRGREGKRLGVTTVKSCPLRAGVD